LSPRALMKGLGLDPAPLDGLEKYNRDQPRVPAGNGRASGQWGSGSEEAAEHFPAAPLIGHGQVLPDISVEPAGYTVEVAQEAKCSAFPPINQSPRQAVHRRSFWSARLM